MLFVPLTRRRRACHGLEMWERSLWVLWLVLMTALTVRAAGEMALEGGPLPTPHVDGTRYVLQPSRFDGMIAPWSQAQALAAAQERGLVRSGPPRALTERLLAPALVEFPDGGHALLLKLAPRGALVYRPAVGEEVYFVRDLRHQLVGVVEPLAPAAP